MRIIEHSEAKIGYMYVVNNLAPVSFFNRHNEYNRRYRSPVEMFRPYESFAAIKDGIRAPLAMPFLCLSVAAMELYTAFQKIAMAALQFGTFSPVFGTRSLEKGIEALFSAVYIALKSVFETIRAVIVLATRAISTGVFTALVAGFMTGYCAIIAGAKTVEAGARVINHFRRPKDTDQCSENAHTEQKSANNSTHDHDETNRDDFATRYTC